MRNIVIVGPTKMGSSYSLTAEKQWVRDQLVRILTKAREQNEEEILIHTELIPGVGVLAAQVAKELGLKYTQVGDQYEKRHKGWPEKDQTECRDLLAGQHDKYEGWKINGFIVVDSPSQSTSTGSAMLKNRACPGIHLNHTDQKVYVYR